MRKIKNFFTDDDNLKAITFGLMVGTSLMALISVAALVECQELGTRTIANFFGFENIKQTVSIKLGLAFMAAVLYWTERHRIQHKCIERLIELQKRLIELQNEKADRCCRYVDELTSVILTAGKPGQKKTPEGDKNEPF